jgi:hypothetical protein
LDRWLSNIAGFARSPAHLPTEKNEMRFGPFLALAVALAFVWFCALLMFHVAAAMLDVVLLLALASLVTHFFTTSRRPAKDRVRLL